MEDLCVESGRGGSRTRIGLSGPVNAARHGVPDFFHSKALDLPGKGREPPCPCEHSLNLVDACFGDIALRGPLCRLSVPESLPFMSRNTCVGKGQQPSPSRPRWRCCCTRSERPTTCSWTTRPWKRRGAGLAGCDAPRFRAS